MIDSVVPERDAWDPWRACPAARARSSTTPARHATRAVLTFQILIAVVLTNG